MALLHSEISLTLSQRYENFKKKPHRPNQADAKVFVIMELLTYFLWDAIVYIVNQYIMVLLTYFIWLGIIALTVYLIVKRRTELRKHWPRTLLYVSILLAPLFFFLGKYGSIDCSALSGDDRCMCFELQHQRDHTNTETSKILEGVCEGAVFKR